jgi:septal ring factor EnvC (AmiA/AmiB activator)
MATQDSIDKIINIRFNYKELVQGWVKANEAIEDNKKILADLKKEYETGQISLSDYKKAQLELKSTTKALTDEQRQYEKEIQNNIKVEKELDGSLNQLRANLNGLIAQYGRLSAAERESASGKALADHIKAQRDAVKEAEAAIGDYRSNVGNYENAIQNTLPVGNNFLLQLAQTAQNAGGVTNVIKGAAGAIGSLVKQMAAFIATPIGAAIAAIYASYQALSFSIREVNARIQENEELFYKNQRAMSAADAWNAAYTNSVDRMGEVMVETTSKFKTFWTQLKILAKNVMRSGFIGGFISFLGQGVEANELQKTFDELAAKQEERNTKYREDVVRIAELEAEIADARLKSNDKLKNSDAERAKYAQEAIDKTREMFRIKKDIAQLDFEIAKLSAEPTKNSVETNDKLAEMEAGLKRLNAQENSALRELQERLNETNAKSILDRAGIKESEKSSKSANDDPYADESGVKKAERMMEGYYARSKQELQKWVDEQREIIRKTGIDVMGDFEKILSQMDKEVSAEFISQYNQKQSEYRNRILNAQATGGDEAAQNETVAILREQLAEFDSYAAAYRAMGDSAIEIDNRRLEMLIRLHDEMNKGAQKETQSMQMSFQAASDLAGALGGLAEEAGASAPVVAMLGIAQAIASMGAALSKAFSSSATVWDGIAGAVAAISTITTIISQIKSLNSTAAEEGAKYHYARGGLVTGPGTGTSDSIPARLSNGEAVMTARAVVDWGPVLSMMNVSSGGNAIPTRHLPEKSSGMRQMEQMFERVMRRLPNPVVTVRDINNGQRRVKVQDETARYTGRKR